MTKKELTINQVYSIDKWLREHGGRDDEDLKNDRHGFYVEMGGHWTEVYKVYLPKFDKDGTEIIEE